jgi:hypothetical protein
MDSHSINLLARRCPHVRPFRRHPWLFTALLAALFVRALVPDGFMPAKGELVEFCTMHGVRMVLADPDTGELLPEEQQAAQGTCPWSLLLTTLATPSSPRRLHGLAVADAAVPGVAVSRTGRSSIVVPPARAPPSRS